MELKQLQGKASKVFLNNLKRDNIKASEDYLILKLTEEFGEFVQSYLVHKKRCRLIKYMSLQKSKKELSKELADVLGLVFVIAQTSKINLEEALIKKWVTKEWIKNN
jgi:NTP pyrophosphatase (non-canonical NTP hydrolase)